MSDLPVMRGPKTHFEKTHRFEFNEIWGGQKLSKIRYDNGDYRIADSLEQREWSPEKTPLMRRSLRGKIIAITRISQWIKGVGPEWVILHFDPFSIIRTETGRINDE